MTQITIARVYMQESEHHLDAVLKFLHDDVKVRHVIVLRGIEGFEKGGKVHSSHFLSLSLDLPLVVEFFDTPEKVEKAAEALQKVIGKGRLIMWQGLQLV